MYSSYCDESMAKYIILFTRVSVRYGEVELNVSEMSHNISRETSVISYLSYTDGKCARAVEH